MNDRERNQLLCLVNLLGAELTYWMIGLEGEPDAAEKERRMRRLGPLPCTISSRIETAFRAYETLHVAGDSDDVIRAWFIGHNELLDDKAPAERINFGALNDVTRAANAFAVTG